MNEKCRIIHVKKNIYAAIVNRVVSFLCQFVIRAAIIRTLGAEYLGLNSLFISVLQMLNIAELGIGNAITYRMYRPFAENDKETICSLLNVYRKLYYSIGASIIGFGIAFMPFLQFIIKGDCPSDINVYILYVAYILNTSIGYLLFSYKAALFVADNKDYIQSNIRSLVTFLGAIGQIVVLEAFTSYYGFLIVIIFTTIVINISIQFYSLIDYSWIKCKGRLSDEDNRELKKNIIGMMSYKIGGALYENLDVVIISAFFGLSMQAKYTNYYYILLGLRSVLAVLQSAMTSAIGHSIVKESLENNIHKFKMISGVFDWIIGWFAICMACLFQPFMICWMGNSNLLEIGIAVLFAVYFYFDNWQPAVGLFKNAAGIWWPDRFRPLAGVCVNGVLDIMLAKFMGISGIIIASIVTQCLVFQPWGTHYLFKCYLKISLVRYFLEKICVLLMTTVIGAFTYALCTLLWDRAVAIELLYRALVCLIIPNLMFYFYYKIAGKWNYMRFAVSMMLKPLG